MSVRKCGRTVACGGFVCLSLMAAPNGWARNWGEEPPKSGEDLYALGTDLARCNGGLRWANEKTREATPERLEAQAHWRKGFEESRRTSELLLRTGLEWGSAKEVAARAPQLAKLARDSVEDAMYHQLKRLPQAEVVRIAIEEVHPMHCARAREAAKQVVGMLIEPAATTKEKPSKNQPTAPRTPKAPADAKNSR